MKNLFVVFFILALPFISFSQPEKDAKRDYVWLTGYDSNNVDSTFGGTRLDFGTYPVDIYQDNRPMNFSETNASICDEYGNLLFYTNGISIAQANHTGMVNGNGLSPGGLTEYFAEDGLFVNQGVLILPLPDSDDEYYVFHLRSNLSQDQTYVYSDKLFYSIVDMGHPAFTNGWVKDKNTELLSDTLESGSLTSCRHANGRDWWILVNKHDSNHFYRFLFSHQGIELIGNQEIGNSIPSGLGQSVFTPDGNKFIKNNCVNIYDEDKRVDIYDFDRCTGILSNPQNFIYGDSSVTCGIAVSPNSRYLYATLSLYTYQFDLQASDILASKDTVAIFDWFQPIPGFVTTFSYPQLAPDGKIYITTNFSLPYLHVIHNPNEAGEACDMEQHGITLPTFNDNTIPNFPNFRLGSLEGSPCDTLDFVSTDEIKASKTEFTIFPNPASEFVSIKITGTFADLINWRLYNQLGQIVKEKTVFSNDATEISVQNLPKGIYFYDFKKEDKVIEKGKIVIQ